MAVGFWLAGFTSGESCLFIGIRESNVYSLGFQVYLVFKLTQHERDEKLVKNFIKYFECGNIYQGKEVFDFKVIKYKDITYKIIPFFKKYYLYGVKSKDF